MRVLGILVTTLSLMAGLQFAGGGQARATAAEDAISITAEDVQALEMSLTDVTLPGDGMDEVESCSCDPIVCDGKQQAKGCNVNCDGKAICLCGKCSYGSFNRCSCK